MRIRSSPLLAAGIYLAPFIFAGAAAAQNFPFQLVVQQADTTQAVADGTTLSVAADSVNKPVMITLTATYMGTTSVTLGTPQLLGTAAFTITASSPGATLQPGQSTAFSIVFTPTTFMQVSAVLTIPFTQAAAPMGVSSSGFISLGLAGTAPNFLISYLVPPASNAIPLADGGIIQFPPTTVGGTSTVTLDITNNGSAGGMVNAFSLSGAAFQTLSLPLLPGTLGSGQTLQVTIQYKPTAAQSDKGTIQISLPSQTVTIALTGTGTAAQLQYQISQGNQTSTVAAGQTIAVVDTNVGSTSTVTVSLTNAGSADAVVNAISITGQGFQLTDAPILPLTIVAGGAASVTFAFTPPQAGTFTGRLRIGADSFPLSGKGLGTNYQYSYTAGSASTTVLPNGSIFFAPVAVGQNTTTSVTVTNAGTIAGTISSISIGEANSPFTLSNLPPLPVTLAPGQAATFNVSFTPATAAAAVGTLHVDAAQFALSGSGTPPPALPAYSFTGASGTQAPLQQPSIGLNLASGYPLALAGTLTMNVTPDGFTADPAIQFSTGGRTVAFTIPPGATSAVFANGNTSVKLQTGSTSGTIVLTPSFQTAGGAQVTPSNPQTLQFQVPRVAPLLVGAQVTGLTAAQLTIAITGVSNSQALTRLDFTFAAQSNFSLNGATLSVPLSGVAAAWFQSAAAQPFGGQFVATVPFSFTSDTTSLTTPTNAIKSITVTATNDQGTSAPVTINVQ